VLGKIAAEEKDKADAARMIVESKRLDDMQHQYTDDPQHGALMRQGFDAIGVYDQTKKAWDVATSAIEASLANPRQKQMYSAMRDQRWRMIGAQLERHTQTQVAKANSEAAASGAASALGLAVAAAANAPDRDAHLERAAGITESWATAAGLNQDTVKAKVAETRARGYAEVANRLISSQATFEEGRKYLKAHADEIAAGGGDVARLEAAVDRNKDIYGAYAETDRILAATSDWTEAGKMAGKASPEIRAAVVQEIDAHFRRAKAQADLAENKQYEEAADQLRILGSLHRLKARMGAGWLDLYEDSRARLEAIAERIAKGPDMGNDGQKWQDFALLPPDKMALVNPMKELRPYLDNAHFDRAIAMVAAARYGQETRDFSEFTYLQSAEKDMQGLAQDLGIDPKEQGVDTPYALMQAEAQGLLTAFEAEKGRKANPVERKQILAEVGLRVYRDRPFWRDVSVRPELVADEQVGKVYYPIAKIPQAEALIIQAAVAKAGVTLTTRHLEHLFGRWLVRLRQNPEADARALWKAYLEELSSKAAVSEYLGLTRDAPTRGSRRYGP
jgi:hypothetical protein